jgi:uncharacterized membrane protein
MSFAGKSRDLALVAAGTLVSLILIALPFEGFVKAMALLPMVLFLPGYALAAALFPDRRSPGRAERAIYVFALSVAAASLGGLVWQFAFELTRASWAFLLGAITLAGCEVARRRRRAPGAIRSRSHPSRWRRGERALRLDAPTAITVLIGVGAAVAAVVIATDGLQEQRAEARFSALWAVPLDSTSGAVEVGVLNHQGTVHDYRLEVEAAGREIQQWRGRLGSRERKRVVLPAGTLPPGTLVFSLYRDGSLYRRTELHTGTGL